MRKFNVCPLPLVTVWIIFALIGLADCQSCPNRDLSRLESGRQCERPCRTSADCRGSRKRCMCDGICGMSCFNPGATCRPALAEIPNGRFQGDQTIRGEVVYSCNEGYMLRGNSKRLCRGDRTWSGETPRCLESCTVPDLFSDSFPDTLEEEFAVGEMIRYACRFGFDISGDPSVECLPGGVWSQLESVCVRKDCGDPGRPRNGYREGELGQHGFRFGGRVSFACNTGYELEGSKTLSCTTRGVWNRRLPVCRIVECGVPEEPEHGSVDTSLINEFVYNTEIRYTCDRGYRINGNAVGRCDENQSWGEIPECEIDTDCDFEDSRNPLCSYESGGLGWMRTFSSNVPNAQRGYLARSRLPNTQRNVEATLTSPRIPQENTAWCLRFHYKVDALSRSSDFTVSLLDNDGSRNNIWRFYNPKDPKGAWLNTDHFFPASTQELQIQFRARKSDIPTAVELDDITVTRSSAADCVDECAGETCLNGGTCVNRIKAFQCYCVDGYEGERCEIEIRCIVPDPPRFGSVRSVDRSQREEQSLFYNSLIEYACDYTYRMVGVESGRLRATCRLNRRWTRRTPTCEKILCAVPDHSRFVVVSPREGSFTLDEVITYTCVDRYRMESNPSGELRATCREDSTWSHDAPTCVEIDCAQNNPRFGSSSTDNRYTNPGFIALGGRLTYTCNHGYEMEDQPSGELTVTCRRNRRWSQDLPTCIQIFCTVPESFEFGTISTSARRLRVDERFQYECNEGYRMEGRGRDRLTVSCQSDRTWTSNVPTCTLVQCLVPNRPQFGFIDKNFNGRLAGLEATITYSCRDNYVLVGERRATCQRDDTWSSDVPMCIEITCRNRAVPQNAEVDVTKQRWVVGDTVTYSCVQGHRLVGQSMSTCRRNGRWSSATPSCDEIFCESRNPPAFSKASNSKSRWSPQDVVTYTCVEGYEVEGSKTSECLLNGEWSDDLPECKRIRCRHRGTPDGASAVPDKLVWFAGDSVTYSCDVDFVLEGEATSTCQSNKRWSNDLPTCTEPRVEVPCDFLGIPEFGSSDDDKAVWMSGEAVTYQCENDYELVGEAMSTCQANGSWSNPLPVCTKPPSPCPDGYVYNTHLCLHLQEKSTYNTAFARCEEEDATLPIVRSLEVHQTLINSLPPDPIDFWIGLTYNRSTNQYIWDTGEVFNRREFTNFSRTPMNPNGSCARYRVDISMWTGRSCRSQRGILCMKWSADVRPLIVSSQSANSSEYQGTYTPENGMLRTQAPVYRLNHPTRKAFLYKFLSGEAPDSSAFWIISESSQGSVPYVFARSSAALPQDVQGRWRSRESEDISISIVEYHTWGDWMEWGKCSQSCGKGRESRNRSCLGGNKPGSIFCPGPSQKTRSCNTERCKSSCTVAGIAHGSVSPKEFSVQEDATVTYSCDGGYKISGQDASEVVATCQRDETFDVEPPQCVEITCTVPDHPQNGNVSTSGDVTIGRNITYECNDDFVMVGQPTGTLRATCLEDGSWSDNVPICSRVCNVEEARMFSTLSADKDLYVEGSSVTYTCDDGYAVNGRSSVVLTCQNDGNWNSDVPQCLVASCQPVAPQFGIASKESSVRVGDDIIYRCEAGYGMVGRPNDRLRATCERDGTWSVPLPECRRICDVRVAFRFSSRSTEALNVYEGDSVTYTCDEGYEIPGRFTREMTLTCGDGRWSGDPPQCRKVPECDVPLAPRSVSVVPQVGRRMVGEMVEYSCKDGYEMVGRRENRVISRCRNDGEWTMDVPVCQSTGCTVPNPPANGRVDPMSGEVQRRARITFTCNDGYRIEGSERDIVFSTCQDDKTWTNKAPTCVEIKCSVPRPSRFGSVSTREIRVSIGQHVIYTCHQQFQIPGQSSKSLAITCLKNGQFSSQRPSCVGIWRSWGSWNSCSRSCGGGQRTRTRTCPGPRTGDGACAPGAPMEVRECNTTPCPIRKQWTHWGRFEPCSVTCGIGIHTRRRMCQGTTGPDCPGPSTHSTECNRNACRHTPSPVEITIERTTYTIIQRGARYFEARNTCQQLGRGGRLAMIKTSALQQRLFDEIKKLPATISYFLGMTGQSVGSWHYADGTRVPLRGQRGFQNWARREPSNGGGNEHCGEMYYNRGRWNDISCSRRRYFICQREVADPCEGSPCQNEGTCHRRGTGYICECPQLVSGDDCENIDSLCWSSPCQNERPCRGDRSSYMCDCGQNYRGTNCEEEAGPCDNNPCMNGGICNRVGLGYLCGCPNFLSGDNCEKIDSLCWSSPCQNGGRCRGNTRSYTCECNRGYDGDDCQIVGCNFDRFLVREGVRIQGEIRNFYQVEESFNVSCSKSDTFLNSAIATTTCSGRNMWKPDYTFFQCLPKV